MGFYAAHNMHQLMLSERDSSHKAVLLELGEIPPMIGLAVGRKAVSYGPEQGTASGEDVMEMFFGDDLGFTSKWLSFFRLNGSTTWLTVGSLLGLFTAWCTQG